MRPDLQMSLTILDYPKPRVCPLADWRRPVADRRRAVADLAPLARSPDLPKSKKIRLLPIFSASGPSFCRKIWLLYSSLGFVAYNLASGDSQKLEDISGSQEICILGPPEYNSRIQISGAALPEPPLPGGNTQFVYSVAALPCRRSLNLLCQECRHKVCILGHLSPARGP